jgi:hypothetical protein
MNRPAKPSNMDALTMKSKTYLRKSLAASIFKACLATGLTLAVGSYSQPTQAQWLVQDNTSILKAVKEYAEQAKRWAQTMQQYQATVQHYAAQVQFWQQQLIKLQSLSFESFALQNQFQKIPDDYGINDECPGVSGGLAGDITSALQSFIPNMGGDVVKQQRQLCQLIVMTKNRKYNKTVDYLQSVATATKDLAHIGDDRATAVGEDPGKLAAIVDDTNRYSANLDTAKQTWETDMQQSDAQIQMLQQIQSNLSRRAMNGQPSPLGTLVNVAAMKAAFQ